MLEYLTQNFRELLRHFEGSSCPLCSVMKQREHAAAQQVRDSGAASEVLCGPHLEISLTAIVNPATRGRVTRTAIESVLADKAGCDVCTRLSRIELRLAGAIRRLDGGMRFRKALESAPLFCRKHQGAVAGQGITVNFEQVQRAKILQLRDALAQAELFNREGLEDLILRALAYLGGPLEEDLPTETQDPAGDGTEEAAEFQRWEETRQFKHLAALESEAASLRYRNAMLHEENRRLKLANVAGEAARRDLERDRAQLLAEAKGTG
jgi:hypothetical protein